MEEFKIHFEPFAVEKYIRVTNEVANDINKITVRMENEGNNKEARRLNHIMKEVCDISYALEKNDLTIDELKKNAGILRKGFETIQEMETFSGEYNEYVKKLEGLYNCWQKLFNIEF